MNEGLNLARPLGDPWNCGYQIGANFVQSDFSGASVVTADNNSIIFTPRCESSISPRPAFSNGHKAAASNGASPTTSCTTFISTTPTSSNSATKPASFSTNVWEVGYFGAYGVSSRETRTRHGGRLNPTDMFVLFVRRNFENGGDGRIWAGGTGNGDGLLGADLGSAGKRLCLGKPDQLPDPKQGKA